MMTIAAAEVQQNISGAGSSQASHERKPVFQQLLRVTVLLMRPR
jgi:hypothetical protein